MARPEGHRRARFKNKRRWERFAAYLPVQCTVLDPGKADHRQLTGTTLNIGAGGIALLLGETLALGIPIMITLGREEPIRGHVVWTDRRMLTFLKTAVPHGVAFEKPVDASWVQQWVSQGRKRAHVRAPVLLDVEFTPAGTGAHGTCFNLGQGGMFIATEHPSPPGTEVILRFALPSVAAPLSVRGRVAWISGQDREASAVTGMGVQFLDLNPMDAAVIGTFVDRLRLDASAPDASSRLRSARPSRRARR
ncbi:MAG: PilZ domain-containing protein [Nitrospiraceae bacterium]